MRKIFHGGWNRRWVVMPRCNNCDAHVSHDFFRVFECGKQIEKCPSCGTTEEVMTQGQGGNLI